MTSAKTNALQNIKKRAKTLIFAMMSAFLASLAICICILLFATKNPLQSIATFFASPFASIWHFGNLCNTWALLSFASLGLCISFNAGCFNLGGDGQIYLAGFITCLCLNATNNLPPILSLLLAFLLATTSAGLLAMLSALLKHARGIDILLSSFLLSSVAVPLIDYAITSPLRDTNGTLLALPFIAEAVRLARIMSPSSCTVAFPLAIFTSILIAYALYCTKMGKRFCLVGKARDFAYAQGISLTKTTYFAMFASGALHGVTGFFAVTGTYFTAHQGFANGTGWNALSLCLMASTNPALLIPCGFLIAYMLSASESVIFMEQISINGIQLVQGVMLFVLATRLVKNRAPKRKKT